MTKIVPGVSRRFLQYTGLGAAAAAIGCTATPPGRQPGDGKDLGGGKGAA